jgi:TldD protein
VKGVGEVSWATPIERNAMEVPIKDKVDLLLGVNAAAMGAGASFVNSILFLVNEQKYFASTDGSYIDQDIHRIWAPMTVTAVDQKTGKFRSREGLSAPRGMGFEYLDAKAADKVELPGGAVVYGDSYDMKADAIAAAKQAREKLAATSVKPGKYDLVLDPSHLWLTIHESVGHPTELDRVLGYEANYAGTSFATLDKWKSKDYRYGSDKVTIFADKVQKGTLGAVGYDDEGVKTQRWDLIRDGILVNYQAIRDQAHILGLKESQGCCYADSWSSVQFQRMANVSLAPGKDKLTPADMIKDVENGIYIIGDGSFSIDQQRYNAQFGGQLFYEIKDGKVTRPLEDVAYQMRTPEFWNSCVAVCDESDYHFGGSFFDGKGQPGQVSAVSHGSSTARFNGANVINTARSLG